MIGISKSSTAIISIVNNSTSYIYYTIHMLIVMVIQKIWKMDVSFRVTSTWN